MSEDRYGGWGSVGERFPGQYDKEVYEFISGKDGWISSSEIYDEFDAEQQKLLHTAQRLADEHDVEIKRNPMDPRENIYRVVDEGDDE